MQTASTTQFRKAVKLAMAGAGVSSRGSWTENPNDEPSIRYVGFRVYNAELVAKQAEVILKASGVTAKARVTGRNGGYVRGTCVLDDETKAKVRAMKIARRNNQNRY